jgi:4a-hydroxytetrahydrobiopterin dehydratase
MFTNNSPAPTSALPTPNQLSKHHCVPCEGGTAPLTPAEYEVYLPQLKDWIVLEQKSIQRHFEFKNFSAAVDFINEIAKVAESEGHHPDLFLHDYRQVTVTLSTHAIKGLSINDFVMAQKIDELFLQSS